MKVEKKQHGDICMMPNIICPDEPAFLLIASGKEYKEIFPKLKIKLEENAKYYLPLCEYHFRCVLSENLEKFKGAVKEFVFDVI